MPQNINQLTYTSDLRDRHLNQIIYNSDLIIRSRQELATLCVFYDKVFLPYTSPETSRKFSGPRIIGAEWSHFEQLNPGFYINFINDVNTWWGINKILFEEQVLERLPPWADTTPRDHLLAKVQYSERAELFTKAPALLEMTVSKEPIGKETPQEDLTKGILKERFIKQDLVLHFLRDDLQLPQLFVSESSRPPREFLKAIEAKAVFSYLLPTISSLTPDEILEVRKKVKDTREGFSMHLQKLSRGIEDKLKGGEPITEIEAWVQRVIHTELIPDYREFRSQLQVERLALGKRILDVIPKICEIDAAVWTPKFWGELIRAFCIPLPSPSERKDKLSNKNQAYQFMRIIEDIDK